MNYRIGSGYLGSDNVQTSVANQEIIPDAPAGWTSDYSLYKFSLSNQSACHMIINGGDPIYFKANQGFNVNKEDYPISSIKIVENGILFNWVGAY